jgi:hypothetical protein
MTKQVKTLEDIANNPVNRNEIAKIKFYARMSAKARTLINDYFAQQGKKLEQMTYGDLNTLKSLMEAAKKNKPEQNQDQALAA